jgi:PAS domain S-box-containing protein
MSIHPARELREAGERPSAPAEHAVAPRRTADGPADGEANGRPGAQAGARVRDEAGARDGPAAAPAAPVAMRVLVVDDEETSLMAIRGALEGIGVQIVTAASGRGALREVLLQEFAVILLDVRMTELDGFETAELIRRRRRSRETPIIFLTGADTHMMRAYGLGAVDYLVKPFPMEALRSKVRVFVELAEARARLARVARENEARAVSSEDKYRELMEHARDAILVLDAEGRVLEANGQAEALLARSRARLAGMRLHELFDGGDAPGRELLSVQPREVQIAAGEGEPRWCEVSVTSVRPGGTPLALAILHDVTDRRRAADAIRDMNTRLEQQVEERTHQLRVSNEELEAFSYSVAHDLRAPLRSIIGYSTTLADELGTALTADRRQWLDAIAESTRRMARIIEDLLDLSRVTRREIRREPVDVSALVRDLCGELAREEPERVVEVDVEDGLVVSADPTLLRLALGNLLSNAWKFTRTRPVAHLRVARHATMPGVFLIRDDGVGFDGRYASKLFRPFERLHVDGFEGTGVGLAIVERVVRRHGGHVWAESIEHHGATFYVSL